MTRVVLVCLLLVVGCSVSTASVIHRRPSILSASKDLIFVQLIFRHGDRAPDKFYVNSPSVNSWPQGASQLTPLGIEQHYALGSFLHERYADFLGLDTASVTFNDVYIRASDVERTITSAQANAASFFAPPSPSSSNSTGRARAWNTTDSDLGTLWTPVPIHTAPIETDFFMEEAKCPRLDKLIEKLEDSDTIQDILNEKAVKDLIHQVADVTGEPHKVKDWTLLKKFKDVADTLACERRHNMTLPGVNSEFYDDVEKLAQRAFPIPYVDSEIASLHGGCLLGHISDHMADKMANKHDGTFNSRKLVVFSSHDKVIMGVLSSAGLYNKVAGVSPPFTATAIFELYADGNVQVLYKDDVSSLDAIRHKQPRLLLSGQLADLLKKWKYNTFTGDDCEKACDA